MMNEKSQAYLSFLKERFIDAGCSLDFQNDFECLIAILLSAQTTDRSVNLVTPELFKAYPSPEAMSKADEEAIGKLIRRIGIYRNKARNCLALSRRLVEEYGGSVPHDFDALIKLPGVGRKTAGVFLLERALRPAIPVDTHIARVAARLGYAKEGMAPEDIERKLEGVFPKEEWALIHHGTIRFGREICHAKNPSCRECPMRGYCHYFRKNSSMIGK